MAKQLQEHGWLPSVIMCSNSLRTQQTLDSMKDAVDALCTAEAHFRGSLYTIAALDGQTRRHLQVLGTCTCCWCRRSAVFTTQQAALDVPYCLVAANLGGQASLRCVAVGLCLVQHRTTVACGAQDTFIVASAATDASADLLQHIALPPACLAALRLENMP